jgi:hypothetical protein
VTAKRSTPRPLGSIRALYIIDPSSQVRKTHQKSLRSRYSIYSYLRTTFPLGCPRFFQQLSPRLLIPIFVVPGIRSTDELPVLGRSGTRMACMTNDRKAVASFNLASIGSMLLAYLKITNTVPVFPVVQSQVTAATNIDEKSLGRKTGRGSWMMWVWKLLGLCYAGSKSSAILNSIFPLASMLIMHPLILPIG